MHAISSLNRTTLKPLRLLMEPLQVAKDNGAKRALIPIENKRRFLDVSADIMGHVDPIFAGSRKALLGFWETLSPLYEGVR